MPKIIDDPPEVDRAEMWAKLDGLKGKRKQEWVAFHSMFVAIMREIGAKPEHDDCESWRLRTLCGWVSFVCYPNSTEGPGWIAARFADPEFAKRKLEREMNPHSGKWNHHYFDGWTADAAIADFASDLNRILGLSSRIHADRIRELTNA